MKFQKEKTYVSHVDIFIIYRKIYNGSWICRWSNIGWERKKERMIRRRGPPASFVHGWNRSSPILFCLLAKLIERPLLSEESSGWMEHGMGLFTRFKTKDITKKYFFFTSLVHVILSYHIKIFFTSIAILFFLFFCNWNIAILLSPQNLFFKVSSPKIVRFILHNLCIKYIFVYYYLCVFVISYIYRK